MADAFYYQLGEALDAADSCALCWLESRQVSRYLQGVANDGVNNIPLRLKLEKRGGYCGEHLSQFVDLASPLPSAILIDAFLKMRLRNAAAGKKPITPDCEACEVKAKTRRSLAKNIKRRKREAEVLERLQTAQLCLEHLELACRELPETARAPLVAHHDELLGHLSEVIRKHDYRFSDEVMTDEEKGSIREGLRFYRSEE